MEENLSFKQNYNSYNIGSLRPSGNSNLKNTRLLPWFLTLRNREIPNLWSFIWPKTVRARFFIKLQDKAHDKMFHQVTR
jgi:hypothetical protein